MYFFSLDAASALAVMTARALFHLPYYRAKMEVDVGPRRVSYRSARTAGASGIRRQLWAPDRRRTARPGTLEYFLTERYRPYTTTRAGLPRRLEIHHRPWPLQPADAQIAVNTMTAASGIALPVSAPLVHFAKRMDARPADDGRRVTWANDSPGELAR